MNSDLDLLQPPMAEAATQFLVDKLADAIRACNEVIVELDNFQNFADLLDSIKQVFIDLEDGGDIFQLEAPMRELEQELDEALGLIVLCTVRSRIYLLFHCRVISKQLEDVTHRMGHILASIPSSSLRGDDQQKSVVDDLALEMKSALFPYKDNEAKLCQTLEPENRNILSDVGVQQAILMDIARTVGIEDLSRNPTAFRIELDLLRRDVEDSKNTNDMRLFGVVSDLFNKWLQLNEQPSQSEEALAVHPCHKRLEPLYEAFVCPLTKQVMQDPVTLENGQTYERAAIERWFQECKENGRPILCPMTGQEVSTTVKPSLALWHTIEEWTQRNEQARMEIVKQIITSGKADADIAFALSDLQILCRKNRLNKHRARTEGLIPLIVDLLKNSEEVRCLALSSLRLLAENDDDIKEEIGATDLKRVVKCLSREHTKEREGAVYLLYELSKSYSLCNKIGETNGAILILVGILSSNSEDVAVVDHAEKALANLERCDNNVKQMAENGRLQPLLKRLVEGPEEVRIEMAEDLSIVPLTSEDKSRAAQRAAFALVEMLGSHNSVARATALKALRSLSTLPSNGNLLIEAGVLSPLMRDLFIVGPNQVPTKQKEISAGVLANVVGSGANWETVSVDKEGNFLASEKIVHNFLHLVSNTGPGIGAKVLQVLVGLASSNKSVTRLVQHIRSAGATVSLIQFLEAPQADLRVTAVKLLMLLSSHMDQELADGLRVTTRQLGTLIKLLDSDQPMEEQAVAAGLLANLPMRDYHLTRAMLDEGAPALLLKRLDDLKRGVVRPSDRRHITPFKTGMVGILVRFTCALDDQRILNLASTYNFTELFTSLLQSGGSDELQNSAAKALENLSEKTPQLSSVPDPPKPRGIYRLACFKQPTPLIGLCPVHSGVCTSKETFCLLHAKALLPLVSCLDHRNPSIVEAAIGALSTLLMDTVDMERGSQELQNAGGIQPILVIMQEHRTEVLRQRAVWMVERILRNGDLARQISGDPHVHTALVDAFRYGNNQAKQLAEKALKHLNKIPNFSGVFQKV
ncbi:U-box domain-containing protein 43 [Physcomitrium patens]|uniref:RING-type E3 ubiquitin transferase n=1 Tax=Physcomitrium patens TaxID=3218 RepID=A0A2K1K1N8_PHYPA|nr:U-box domain-containing protein 43-like [Physcomitrium patens]PNR47695.1 hypothetical protein PHYPA_012168 [Physcomitrium patens]|eukprot:XP_024384626.1 U-box domain-containing protein 43-like [Physcomitrella patens]